MKRADVKRNKRLAQIRRANRTYRKRLKEKAAAAEKAKRSEGIRWSRPQDHAQAPEPRNPLTAEEEGRVRGMEPHLAKPAPLPVPRAPAPEPEPESGVDPEARARDKARCDKAAADAIEKDQRTMQKLMARDPDEAPCRLCGEPDGLREHCWVCESCYQSRSWPFFNDPCPVDAYDPTIHAILEARARRKVTRIFSKCECGKKVPTPEGVHPEGEMACDECMRILEGDRAAGVGTLRMKV
jgi:hypothetical protein